MSEPMQKHAPAPPASDAAAVIVFWREAGPERWFVKDDAFDEHFRTQCSALYEKAARGELDFWLADPEGALALILLLDQFPRNCFRGTPRMFATDAAALAAANAAIEAGHDRAIDPSLRLFLYLPFEHSESAWPIRTARLHSLRRSARSFSLTLRSTGRSSGASGGFRIATPSSGARRRRRSSASWTKAVSPAE